MNVKFAAVFFVWKDEEAEKEESRYYRQAAIYIYFTQA